MELLRCILTANSCYKVGRTIKPLGVMVHSTGASNPNLRRYVQPVSTTPDRAGLLARLGANTNGNDWNREGQWVQGKWVPLNVCVHGFIGKLADGVVICHQEGYRRGIASNHGDVLHWFPRHGKSMDDFRADVAAELGQTPAAPTLEAAGSYDAAKAGAYTVTAADGLNIRAGAGTDKPLLGTLAQGAQVSCYGYYSAAGGVDWLLVAANGVTGYVSAAYLKAEAVPPVDSSSDINNKEDDDMVYYARLADVADSYKPTIRKLMERGALKGHSDPDPDSMEDNVLNISEDYCRVMATLDRLGLLG